MQLWTRVHRPAFSQSATTVLHYFCTWLDCHAVTIYNNGQLIHRLHRCNYQSLFVDLPSLLFSACSCIKFYTDAQFLGPSYLLSVNTKMSYWCLNLNLLCPTTDWTLLADDTEGLLRGDFVPFLCIFWTELRYFVCRPTPDEAAQWRESLDKVLNNSCRCTYFPTHHKLSHN